METCTPWVSGGIAAQPDWWMDIMGWFAPVYDQVKFASKMRAVAPMIPKGTGGVNKGR